MVRQSPPPQSIGSRANGQAFSREVSSGNEGAKVTWGGLHNKRGKDQLRAFDTGGTQDPVSLAAQSSLKQVHRALLISVLPAQAWPSPGGTGAQSNNQAGRTRIHQNSRRPSLSCLSLFQTNQTGQNPNSRLEGRKWGQPCTLSQDRVGVIILDLLRAVPRERHGQRTKPSMGCHRGN